MSIQLPSKPKIVKQEKNSAIFEVEGCYPGYGVTLGNALRRVLLSSLSGAAVTGVKIKGAQHEFSVIPGVKEDVINIILNLKQLRIKMYGEGPFKTSLKVKGEKEVRANDFKPISEIEIVNKDLLIATLTSKKAELDLEIEIAKGLGYVPVEQRKKEKLEIGMIALDSIFTPILKVNFEVSHMRVGERTDYDRLIIYIETDGSISPVQALTQASKILKEHFLIFDLSDQIEKVKIKPACLRRQALKKKVKKSAPKKKAGKKK